MPGSVQLDHGQLAEVVAARVCKRRGSVFRRVGEEVARKHAGSLVSALERDLRAEEREAVRGAAMAMIEELVPHGLSYSDLRFLIRTLRAQVREAIPETDDHRVEVEDWFFDLLMAVSIQFMVGRDQVLQAEARKLQVERVESQLAELEVALEEKTSLLEVIRQASTPIAPVVRGILVIPLVGMFDAFRAEILTERLLSEVGRVHARAAILDISGVPTFDTEAAQLIIRLARSVRLLGTSILLVGMSPQNARTIVDLGIDLTNIRTFGTLQDGLAHALVLQRMKITQL